MSVRVCQIFDNLWIFCYAEQMSKKKFRPAERKQLCYRLADVHGWICWYCGLAVTLGNCHIDHIIPKSVSDDDGFYNLALSCRGCNWAKHTLSAAEHIAWLGHIRSDDFGTVASIPRKIAV